MDRSIRDSLKAIQPLFENELQNSIETVIEASAPYGYALLIGEDVDLSSVIAVTNTESALSKGNAEDQDDVRYIPDEWQDWHQHHFEEFNQQFDLVYRDFEQSHVVTDSDYIYTDDAIEFMNEIYSIYLNSLKSIQSKYPSIWYWMIWISDSDRDIIRRSFFELNSGKALQDASKYFRE